MKDMSLCKWCGKPMNDIGWNLIIKSDASKICNTCESSLEKTSELSCIICHQKLQRRLKICYGCIKWEKMNEWQGVLVKNRSIYYYNDFLKEIIAKYKYRGDYEMVTGFTKQLQAMYKKFFKGAMVVPIPFINKISVR
jgi:competence protein ComFC